MRVGRWVLAISLMAAGVAHFLAPALYAKAVPGYLPSHLLLVELSGAAEIACGAGLLFRATRTVAAWGLVLLLVAVFPANIWMVQHPERFAVPLWALWLRLPLQIPLIAWAWLYTRPDTIRT